MKKLNLEITCCADCPYNVYHEYNDVGTSFGLDWYCTKGAGKVYTDDCGRTHIIALRRDETQRIIRENCPL